ncbi:ATP-binding protein [Halomarina oriensis]|uniref:Chemotaxis protein CheA n=1 Tax=Halomarina oriensis TaxID=671145 RepID=A0A6B0GJQ9_9EURY|nr:ATP-binding protein [Halomarina oriensis]MWG33043.1 hypothetical protein [Halomarina oriensis]
MTVSDEFVRESTSQLRDLSDGLIAIEQAPGDGATLDEAFRTAHSLKGNCAMAGLTEASAVAHAVEDVLGAVRTGEVLPEPDLIDAALDGTDSIESLVEAARTGDTETVEYEASIETLRETLAARREADADADPVVRTDDSAAEEEPEAPPDDLDADVLDALDTAAEYDDLDELLAAMDDDEGLDEMPDLPEAKQLNEGSATDETADETPVSSGDGPFAAPDEASTPEPTGDAPAPTEDDADPFASVQAEVAEEESNLAELQAEIDAVSFGEFDEDDDLSIEELVEGVDDETVAASDETDENGGFRFGEDREDASDAPNAAETDADDAFGEPFGADPEGATPVEADAGFDGSGPFADAPADDVAEATAAGGQSEDGSDDGFDGSGPFAAPDEASTPEPTGDAPAPTEDDADPFASVQAEVAEEESNLAELQAEIDAVSFGEFDEDDDLSIEELIEADPAAEADEAVPETGTPEASTTPSVPTVSSDLTPAVVATDEPAPTVPSVAPRPPEHPADLTPAVGAASGEAAVPERPSVATEAGPDATDSATGDAPADYAAMGWGELQSHAADRSVYRPGMTRTGVEAALAALDDGADTETAIAAGRPDESDEPDESVSASTDTPPVPEHPADLTPAIGAANGEVDVPERPAEATDAPAVPDVPTDLTPAVSAAEGAVDVPDRPAEATADPEPEPELDTDVEDLLADTGFDDLAAADDEESAAEPELDPEVDDLLDSSFEERETDVEFARDTATEAFEDRFGQLFGADEAAVTRTVTSLAESSAADLFADPADERGGVERDRVQSITVDVENAEALLSMVEELTATRFRLEGALEDARSEETVDALSGLQSVTANLRKTVMDLRLMPFETATRDLQRLVRDTARAQDKQVALDVSGREVGLDRSVIDRLSAPLVHVVRNAVDHGIETPESREAIGKDAQGTVEVRAERARDGVVIEIEDDGRGIDVDAVRQRVVDNDLLSAEEASELPSEELYPYVFEPGFSTAEEVTDVSGRGVGMDVVDRVTADLGGSVEVESTPGEGTTVRLRLPITVAVAEVMFVQSGEERYGIPMTAIEEVDELDAVAGDRPLVRLAEALDTPGTHAETGVAVRLRPETRDVALQCDRVVETREVVIRPFEGALGEVPGVSGATLLGDGELVNIIDVATI